MQHLNKFDFNVKSHILQISTPNRHFLMTKILDSKGIFGVVWTQKWQKKTKNPKQTHKFCIWQEIFTASLFWTGFKPKKPKFYKSITFKQRIFN
jgi:hypothetical protein